MHKKAKVQISSLFQAYYQEFISKDYLKISFKLLQQYRLKNRDKSQYQFAARDQVLRIKQLQVFKAWQHIKDYQRSHQLRTQHFNSLLLSRKLTRLLNSWKIVIIEHRNIQLGLAVAQQHHNLKIYEKLFYKWIYSHRSSNKIKRRALMMLSPSAKERFEKQTGRKNFSLNDEEWLQSKLQIIKEQFNSKISEYLLEREHNRTFIQGLKFKICERELNQIFSLQNNSDDKLIINKDLTGAKRSNESRIYRAYPELRFKSKSPIRLNKNLSNQSLTHLHSDLDLKKKNLQNSPSFNPKKNQQEQLISAPVDMLDLKYSIHSALVYQQNNQQIMQNLHLQNQSQISLLNQNEVKNKKNKVTKLLPLPPKRLIQIEYEQQLIENESNYAPNLIFKKLQDQLKMQNQYCSSSMTHSPVRKHSGSYQDNLMIIPLDMQLREHIKTLQNKIKILKTTSYNHHFTSSLNHNATNIIKSLVDQSSSDFNGLTDYIQYGISQDQYRMVFIRMFQTKAASVLFNQWKIRYLEKQMNFDLESLHIIKYASHAFTEWNRVIKGRKLKVKEFQRTKQIHKFYQIFIQWNQWQVQNTYQESQKIRQFKLQTIFKSWISYLEGQGQNLMKILRAQQQFKHTLMTKTLVSLYKNYLKELRVRRFQRKVFARKFFNQLWRPQYLRRVALRRLIDKVNDRLILNERLKYQREFDIKREVLITWKSGVDKQRSLVKKLSALTHYKQTLICKTLISLKKNQRFSQGSRLFVNSILAFTIKPAFDKLRETAFQQKLTESNFQNYRANYLRAVFFNTLRQNTVEGRLYKLFMKKKVFRAWQRINWMKNHDLPQQYREQRVKAVFFTFMRQVLKQKWAQERSVIIERNLLRQKDLKLKKMVFVRFLENILLGKRSKIVGQTVQDFRDHNLIIKSFKILKKVWAHGRTERLLNRVARDFHAKITKRRELKRKQYFESKGLEYDGDENSIIKGRVFTAWRLHTEHKLTKSLVLRRFLDFKRRYMKLRVYLAWRSMAKYEQTPTPSQQTASKRSTQRNPNQSTQQDAHQSINNFQPIDTSFQSQTKTYNKNLHNHNMPLQFQIKSFQDDKYNQHEKQQQRKNYQNPNESQTNNNSNRNHRQTDEKYMQNQYGQQYLGVGVLMGDEGDLTQIRPQVDETPYKLTDQAQDKSLFDELENIFQKNRKWLDEQKEREDFLREMASHYNQRLSHEMSTLRFNTLNQSDKYVSVTSINK